MHEAMLYESLAEKTVQCRLCSHRCKIKDGKRGICAVRENHDGKLYTLVYGRVIAEHIDPIEKKPLFHFYPGTTAYSIGTVGCNFRCKHCQNADISQFPIEYSPNIVGKERTPAEIVNAARQANCASIAYTYTEPTIFFEFAYDIAQLAAKEGIKSVFVSNGYMTEEAARTLAPCLDAINIDLKAFTDDFYKKICGARLQPVLDSIRLMVELGVWVEVTTLIIPHHNDSDSELREIARFIREVDPGIPWHVTRFHPTYKLTDEPPTPVETLRRARKIGIEEGLRYVYEGNVPGESGESTFCYQCGRELIRRRGMMMQSSHIRHQQCPDCGVEIDGVGI
jgi:pyruvate formate lyase activating enzyme